MPYTTVANVGTGTGPAATDTAVKDFELTVLNLSKDSTGVINMLMANKSTSKTVNPGWPIDTYRKSAVQANAEGAVVNPANIPNRTIGNLYNWSQIFSTIVGATGSAIATTQAGGNPIVYQSQKQLAELLFDVENQCLRSDQIGTKYSGQSGAAGGLPSGQTGRRFGSLISYASTLSFNGTGGVAGITSNRNNEATDAVVSTTGALNIFSDGSSYFSTPGSVDQGFTPLLYKQLISSAEQRLNSKAGVMIVPTAIRTDVSDFMPTSRSINRVDSSRGDSISMYEGDFDYNYSVKDNWIMSDAGTPNGIIFCNPEVLGWMENRALGRNTEFVSNIDGVGEQWIMEGALKVANPAGVLFLGNIAPGGTQATTRRPTACVSRTNMGQFAVV